MALLRGGGPAPLCILGPWDQLSLRHPEFRPPRPQLLQPPRYIGHCTASLFQPGPFFFMVLLFLMPMLFQTDPDKAREVPPQCPSMDLPASCTHTPGETLLGKTAYRSRASLDDTGSGLFTPEQGPQE